MLLTGWKVWCTVRPGYLDFSELISYLRRCIGVLGYVLSINFVSEVSPKIPWDTNEFKSMWNLVCNPFTSIIVMLSWGKGDLVRTNVRHNLFLSIVNWSDCEEWSQVVGKDWLKSIVEQNKILIMFLEYKVKQI